MKKLYLILLISTLFCCNKDEDIEQININNDIKFISQIIFKDSTNNEISRKISFNYDQYNRIINGTSISDSESIEFVVDYSINNISNLKISRNFTNPNLNDYEKSYEVILNDTVISLITDNYIQKIHIANDFVNKIAYHNTEGEFVRSQNFYRNNNDDLVTKVDNGGNLATKFSDYNSDSDKKQDPINSFIGESFETDLMILLFNLKTSKNKPKTSLSIDNGYEIQKNYVYNYDDDGFLTTSHWNSSWGSWGNVDGESSGKIEYNYIEN